MRITRLCLLALLLVAGCATNNARIDTAVTTCCSSPDYKTFDVTAKQLPAFLGPLMVSNFSVAFANRGMQPVEHGGDLHVTLLYKQVTLTQNKTRDDFEEKISTGDTMRFIARIIVEIRDAKTGKLVWAGHIQRLHDVAPGDYMHTGKASEALYEAFTEVLKRYPK